VALDVSSIGALARVRDRATCQGGEPLNPDAFVFADQSDGSVPWRPDWVTKAFIRCRKDAGLPHFRLHDLRHFMATEMLNDGTPIAVVSGRLAHARASTTLNVYAHAVPGGDRDAANRLASRLAGGRSIALPNESSST
jgi:integrase